MGFGLVRPEPAIWVHSCHASSSSYASEVGMAHDEGVLVDDDHVHEGHIATS